ncbi:ABC transporter substrate-binding protein [Prauserella marina]|uniref:Pyruvate dehydrogenase E1 component alpha subunit/2-oxoisovalerate dehydrogenase E1 component n=1 Tax=Prauserella marina TaxID=530584 RepID=A0A222VU06_9PSEU|nr:thiamine pyrophosphate-dependent dehydrogenase E1 component subunit alpha [Prauserella marina]ASR37394.1 ABC transporter substrate-binding protein [Prauserella marina]PWV74731.1 pyruvate dehydrogenase E1 component alpha subunit [Prauserella marina]SDD42203.1 pyruvate dehydrogenase E1 component alpha subunit/2-oxoisovalerate dehydrogenase E1 component [Prauserella marina]
MADLELVERLYRTMSLIRRFETAAGRLLADGELAGFLHLSIGQEAVAAGVCDVLGRQDHITTTHRGHGHCVAKGARVEAMFAEIFGSAEGYCGGRSGSMHVADPDVGILGANAIVGACVPIALGGALSASMLGGRKVSVAFFGEGAVAEGVVHESLNLAALWQLPMIFVCENNGYAEMTPVGVHLRATNVADYAAPHRIPAETLDGNDVLAVRAAAEKAVARAREGGGPALLECRTYRWHGHFEGDAQRYRDKSEVEAWRERDPLTVLAARAEESGLPTDSLKVIDEECADKIALAVEWARDQLPARAEALTAHVYRDRTGA